MSEQWQIGDRILDRYEIHKIKTGGMGIVFLCYDHLGKAPVAIKTFQDRFLEKKATIERFKWEAEAWIRIGKHKNIVQAFYFDMIAGRPYIFLVYIIGDERYGPDLKGWIDNCGFNIQKGELDIRKCLHVAIQFCEGMIHAERQFKQMGELFIHRDIKPGNIMMRRDGIVKITDFGLVKAFIGMTRDINAEINKDNKIDTERDGFSKVGSICGTPPYMSPEQCRGETEIDIRSDIYSFGCVLYEMMTGNTPFEGPHDYNYWAQHITLKPRELKDSASKIPDNVNALVMRCLKKEPMNRYQDFSVLKGELDKICNHMAGKSNTSVEKGIDFTNREMMLRAAALDNLGFHEEALSLLNQVVKVEPENFYVYHSLAVISMKLGKYEEGIKNYTLAINYIPPKEQTPHLYFNKERTYMQLKQYLYYDRGYAYMKLKQFESALRDFDHAIELGMRTAAIHNERACVHVELKRHKLAIADFEHALNLNPGSSLLSSISFNMGKLYNILGQYSKAIESFNKTIELNPTHVYAYANRGNAYNNLGRYDCAVRDYEKFIELAPLDLAEYVGQVKAVVRELKRRDFRM